MTKIKIALLALALVLLLGAAPAIAAAAGTAGAANEYVPAEIDLPTQVEIQARDDMSAGVFSQILGPAWSFVCGDNNAFGGIGKYSGLILAILGTFNIAGMAIVVSAVGYQWAVGAVATAESGKFGGGPKYGSMWTPFRHGLSVALCVPVLHGLSLIQVIVIACFGLGINMANYVWGEASGYIVTHVDKGSATTDTQSVIIDAESLQVVQPLFQGVLLQELLKAGEFGYPNERIKEYPTPTMRSQWRQVQVQGDYVIEHRPLEGKAFLWLIPAKGQELGVFGGISVPAPTAVLKDGVITAGGDSKTYKAAMAVTNARIEELAALADGLRPWRHQSDRGAAQALGRRPRSRRGVP